MRILVVEDEVAIANALRKGLQAEGFAVDVAGNGTDGLWRASEGAYVAIVLDLLLPDMSGYDVCGSLRAAGNNVPVLVLTACTADEDETRGLNLGADDFLRKPFSFDVLNARLRALLRRQRSVVIEEHEVGPLRFKPSTRECTVAGRDVSLTKREAAVLEALLRANGAVVEKQQLLLQVWGIDFDGDPNIIDVYLSYLRRKLGKPHGQQLLITLRGSGYRLAAPSN